jgi:hypothetical protein
MFDGIDARPNSGLNTILPFRMSHHEFVRPVCHLYGSPHLLFAQFLHIEITHGIGNATSCHQFYPIGTVLDVVPNGRRDTVYRVRKIGARGQSLIRRQSIGVSRPPVTEMKLPAETIRGPSIRPILMLSRSANCPYPRSCSPASRNVVNP